MRWNAGGGDKGGSAIGAGEESTVKSHRILCLPALVIETKRSYEVNILNYS